MSRDHAIALQPGQQSKTLSQKQTKISEVIDNPKKIVKHLDLKNIYRILYPTTVECSFILSAHSVFTKVHPILGLRKVLTNLKGLKLYRIRSLVAVKLN